MNRPVENIKLWHLVLTMVASFTPIGYLVLSMNGEIRELSTYRKESEKARVEVVAKVNQQMDDMAEVKLLLQAIRLDVQNIDQDVKRGFEKSEQRYQENQKNIRRFYRINNNLKDPRDYPFNTNTVQNESAFIYPSTHP